MARGSASADARGRDATATSLVPTPLTMVVADNGAFRRFLRTYLAVRSHRCVEASGLAEAARVVRLSRPALVLLDLGVGDGDVREFTERVRADTRARVLVLGGCDDTVAIARCLD